MQPQAEGSDLEFSLRHPVNGLKAGDFWYMAMGGSSQIPGLDLEGHDRLGVLQKYVFGNEIVSLNGGGQYVLGQLSYSQEHKIRSASTRGKSATAGQC